MRAIYSCTPPTIDQVNKHYMFTMAIASPGQSHWADKNGVIGLTPWTQVCVPALCMPTNKRDRDRKLAEVFRKLNGAIL